MGKPISAYKILSAYGLLALIGLCGLSGCGQELSAAPAGVYIDASTEEFLKKAFEETKSCTGFENGQFKDLSVVLMPPTFQCPHFASGCSGEYVAPNSVKIGNTYIWRHELIHFLLHVNTGDLDASHQSPLFNTCA